MSWFSVAGFVLFGFLRLCFLFPWHLDCFSDFLCFCVAWCPPSVASWFLAFWVSDFLVSEFLGSWFSMCTLLFLLLLQLLASWILRLCGFGLSFFWRLVWFLGNMLQLSFRQEGQHLKESNSNNDVKKDKDGRLLRYKCGAGV